jgi:hypothetical protein
MDLVVIMPGSDSKTYVLLWIYGRNKEFEFEFEFEFE